MLATVDYLDTRLKESEQVIRQDLEAIVDQRINRLESSMGGRMDALEACMGGRMDALEACMGGRMDALEACMGRLQMSMAESMDSIMAILQQRG